MSIIGAVVGAIVGIVVFYCISRFVLQEELTLLKIIIIFVPGHLISSILIFRSIRKKNARYSKEKCSLFERETLVKGY
jgi:biotin transporter BioY